jgi:hypothetical protein
VTRGSFAARVSQPRISFGELALALAGEFGAVDHAAADRHLGRLAGGLLDTHALAPEDQLDTLGDLLDGFRSVQDPIRVRPLMLDAVLADRAGDPMLLAVLAADVARRAGLEVGIVGAGRRLFVAHRHAARPLVLDPAGLLRGPEEVDERGLGWRCAHQVSFALIDEVLERARRVGDVARALTAAELRLTLPVDSRTRAAMSADLAALRASLN